MSYTQESCWTRDPLASSPCSCFNYHVELDSIVADTLSRLPVYPMADAVLFPGTVLPLHIFEPCYRELVADALAGNKSLAVVMLKGPNNGTSRPLVHDVACVGQIIHSKKLPDGQYNILVQGMQRVRLVEELPLEPSYRCFRAEMIPEPDEQAMQKAEAELARLQSCVLSLRSSVEKSDAQLLDVLRATDDPIQLADILGAAAVSDAEIQQRLLGAADLSARLSTLIDALAEVMLVVGELPDDAAIN